MLLMEHDTHAIGMDGLVNKTPDLAALMLGCTALMVLGLAGCRTSSDIVERRVWLLPCIGEVRMIQGVASLETGEHGEVAWMSVESCNGVRLSPVKMEIKAARDAPLPWQELVGALRASEQGARVRLVGCEFVQMHGRPRDPGGLLGDCVLGGAWEGRWAVDHVFVVSSWSSI